MGTASGSSNTERTYFGFDAYTHNFGKRSFISYRRKDDARIYDVVYRLSTYSGDEGNFWYDAGIGYGARWEKVIRANINISSCVVAFVSNNIFEGYMRKELDYAINAGKTIIPVMVDNYQPDVDSLSMSDRRFWERVNAYNYIPWDADNPSAVVAKIRSAISEIMAKDTRSIEKVCRWENFRLDHPLLLRRTVTIAVVAALLLTAYGLIDAYLPGVMEKVIGEYVDKLDDDDNSDGSSGGGVQIDTPSTRPSTTTTTAAPTGQYPPVFTSFSASSSYNKDKYNNCTPDDAFDGNSSTEWQDGVNGYGIGEYLIARAARLQHVESITIVNGYAGDSSLYNENSRVSSLLVEWEGGSSTISLRDTSARQNFDLGGIDTTWMRFTIEDVYEGDKYQDTCIADIYFN